MKYLPCLAPTFLLIALSATQSISAGELLLVVNPLFAHVPVQCRSGYAYQSANGGTCATAPPQQAFDGTPGMGWTFRSTEPTGVGLTRPTTQFDPPFSTGLPFNQAAFLQGIPTQVSQRIFGFVEGVDYRLSFYLGSRFSGPPADGNQTVAVLIDDRVIGEWSLVSFTSFTKQTQLFRVANTGPHVLRFAGTVSGDHTAFFSGVTIEAVDIADEK